MAISAYTNEMCFGVNVPVNIASFCGVAEGSGCAEKGRYSVVFFKIDLRLFSDSVAVI